LEKENENKGKKAMWPFLLMDCGVMVAYICHLST